MSKKLRGLKKIGQYSCLLAIKESCLLSRNLLGLIFHPFKTLRLIFREEDYSQLALIFGLPFYLLIIGFIFIIGLRFLIQAPAQWGWLAKILLSLLVFFSLAIFFYLTFWLIKIIKLKKK